MEMTIKARDFWKSVPIQYISEGFIISKTGDITIGWEITLPCVFANDASRIKELSESLSKAIRFLPPWHLVHRQDVFYRRTYRGEDRDSFLGRSYEKHYTGKTYLEHKQYIYLTLTSRQSVLRPHSSNGLFFAYSISGAIIKSRAIGLKSIGSSFISSLTASGLISARALSEQDLLENVAEYRYLGRENRLECDVELTPGEVIMDKNRVWTYSYSEAKYLPGYLSRVVKSERYSTPFSDLHTSLGGMVGTMLDCEHIVNSYILTLPKDETLAEMDSRRRRMLSMSQRDAENRINAEELETYLNAVHKENLTTVMFHYNIIVWGVPKQQEEISGQVTAALSRMNVASVKNTFDTPVIWYSGFPGAGCELTRDNFMTMELEGSLCTGICETYQRGIPDGIIKLRDRLRNIPVKVDMQKAAENAGLISNYNGFILGPSGSGKSFFTNTLVRNAYDAGETIFIIDIGDSYEGLCSLINDESCGVDGHYYKWDTISGLSFDAFWDIRSWILKGKILNKQSEGLCFVTSFIQTLWSPQDGWSSSSDNVLACMLKDFALHCRDTEGIIILNDLLSFLRGVILPQMMSDEGYKCGDDTIRIGSFDLNDMLTALGAYGKDGPYGFLLNDKNPRDLISSRFTVFEMQQISESKDKLLPLVLLCIMNAFSAKMKRNVKEFKMMIIEEAWKAIMNETMSPYMKTLWKTSRKYNTSAIVVTQQMSDIIGSSYIHDTILENSDTRILLKPTGNQNVLGEMCDHLGLTPHQKAMVLSMNTGESKVRDVFIALSNTFSGVFTNEVSPQEVIAYESNKGEKKDFIDKLETMSPIEAIRELTED